MRALGSHAADANSMGEVDVALRCGFTPSRDRLHRRRQVRRRTRTCRGRSNFHAINVESPGELDRLDRHGCRPRSGVKARVALRVNPDIDAESHPHISTGLQVDNKFGVPIALARELFVDIDAPRRR